MRKSKIYLLLFSLVLVFLSVAFVKTNTTKDKSATRPNIILILADDIGFETISAYGSLSYNTPRIDQMAKDGAMFEQCYSQSLCSPSRLKIMTGKSNFRNYESFGYIDQNETNFAHILKSAGYSTCIAGKWQLRGDQFAPYKSGFDEYLLWNLTDTTSTYNERYKNPQLIENGKMTKYVNSEYAPKLFVEFIKNFITRKKDSPFLVYYPMVLSHKPFVPTPISGKSYDDFLVMPRGKPGGTPSMNAYFKDEMLYLDKNVGEIIDKVNELGLAENTLILFTGDNGTGVGITTEMRDGRKIPGMKGSTNEYGNHVPLVAYWKGKIKPGQITDKLVDFADFLPTIADAANIDLPYDFITDGKSFLPLLMGQNYQPHEWLFSHYDPKKGGFPKARFVHNKEWKLYESGEIYNVINDPLEKHPIEVSKLTENQKLLISTFRDVFPQMVKRDPVKQKPDKSEKKSTYLGEEEEGS